MTPDEIDALPLDDLCIACANACGGTLAARRKDVEKFTGMCFMAFEIDEFDPLLPPDYAHDIAAAWELVEWLRERKPEWGIDLRDDLSNGHAYRCTFEASGQSPSAVTRYSACCPSAPEAISRAFLKVVNAR
jgi:hypothetical protein